MKFLRVWVNDKPVGRLARHGRGATFVYDEGVSPSDAVSLTMPPRAASYNTETGMLPVFDTNLPEGALLEKIRAALSKTDSDDPFAPPPGRVDAIDVLHITGGNQIGRIRVLPDGVDPERRTPVDNIDDLLTRGTSRALIAEITDRYALRSGVSGAMPKVLVDSTVTDPDTGAPMRSTIQTRNYILKFDDVDFPGLSLNEYHCLEAARAGGNRVVTAKLSTDGKMLSVDRFDEFDGGRYGFEDFASLNGKTAEDKYDGSIEKSLFKKVAEVSGKNAKENLEDLYRLTVTNIALRNGDAHLKNFSLLFSDALDGPFKMSPAYDIVTTRAWIRNDLMALTLGGTKRWPKPKDLLQLGARAMLTPARAREIMDEVARGIQEHMPRMMADLQARGMTDLATVMAGEWSEGLSLSLGVEPLPVPVLDPFLDLKGVPAFVDAVPAEDEDIPGFGIDRSGP